MKTYVILENVRSAHNVGSIFRTADGAGVAKLFLVGCTPTPIDRFGRIQPEIAKTSLGAASYVMWEHVSSIDDCIEKLQNMNVQIVAVEQTEEASDFQSHVPTKDAAYIFGNEVTGVPHEALAKSDEVIYIPMRGTK